MEGSWSADKGCFEDEFTANFVKVTIFFCTHILKLQCFYIYLPYNMLLLVMRLTEKMKKVYGVC